MKRREILKTLAVGAVGVGMAGYRSATIRSNDSSVPVYTGHGKKATFEKVSESSNVSLIKGNDIRDNTFNALKNIEDEIMASLEGKKRILIKPNFVVVNNPLCATHVDSVRGILDFIKPRFKGPIEIGEASVSGARGSGLNEGQGTMIGFRDYGYLPLEEEYGVKLTDLNVEPHITTYIFNTDGNRPQPIRIISKFLDRDQYLISAGKMKTHNCVLVTLSLKNILMGAPKNDYATQNDKFLMHSWSPQNYRAGLAHLTKDMVLHFNMFRIAQLTYPDLGVIDAFESMEGDGPIDGTPIETRLALASTDPLALDFIGTRIMGFDPYEILYLSSMYEAGMGQGDFDKINVIGADINENLFTFKPHRSLVEPYGLA